MDDETRAELADEIEAALTDISIEKFNALETKLAPIFAPDDDTADEATHSIWNLALLGMGENSVLPALIADARREGAGPVALTGRIRPHVAAASDGCEVADTDTPGFP